MKLNKISLFIIFILTVCCYSDLKADEDIHILNNGKFFIDNVRQLKQNNYKQSVRILEQFESLSNLNPPSRDEYYFFMNSKKIKKIIENIKKLPLGTTNKRAVRFIGAKPTKTFEGQSSIDHFYQIAKYEEKIPNAWNDIFIILKYNIETGELENIISNIKGLSKGEYKDYFIGYWTIELCSPIWDLDNITE